MGRQKGSRTYSIHVDIKHKHTATATAGIIRTFSVTSIAFISPRKIRVTAITVKQTNNHSVEKQRVMSSFKLHPICHQSS